MSTRDWIQLALFVVVLAALTKPLGIYIEQIFSGKKTFLHPVVHWLEKAFYRIIKVDPAEEQTWSRYTIDLLVFSFFSTVLTYLLLRYQASLPLNPQAMGAVSPDLAFNTAISFLTNTNWQSYGGESTLSYLSQMVALAIHNFLSAAVGICVVVALIRGLTRKESKTVGNFWTDLIRGHLYLLLPLSFVFALVLISQGVIQNFSAYLEIKTLEGAKQIIAQGPVASQVAIKMLGTNGGGFFNANASHPFENSTPLSNFLQMLSIFLIPSALVYFLGRMAKNTKHAWSIWAAMLLIFLVGVLACAHFEYQGNPNFKEAGLASNLNLEGKEVRFGVFNSSLFAAVTTAASCGAVNSMHDSFTPLGGIVPTLNILFGEVIFGGVGSGLYGMLVFVILTVFIAGLMVGRTPEYLGKKIEGREVKYSMLAILIAATSILGFTAWGVLSTAGTGAISNPGPHGLSEILYAFTSATGNNGSAFGGLSTNVKFYNYALAFGMFLGRFFMIIPIMAIGGSMVSKRTVPISQASFPVHGVTFTLLLIGVIVIVGALTFVPALSLGAISEHFEMFRGSLY